MHNWFECKVSFEKIMENGAQKKVTEPYLVDALSFTEAEARIIEEIRPFVSGEFTVTDIKRARLSELFFNENGDRFYKIKVYFITLDEKSGAEKKTAAQMLRNLTEDGKKADEKFFAKVGRRLFQLGFDSSLIYGVIGNLRRKQ